MIRDVIYGLKKYLNVCNESNPVQNVAMLYRCVLGLGGLGQSQVWNPLSILGTYAIWYEPTAFSIQVKTTQILCGQIPSHW